MKLRQARKIVRRPFDHPFNPSQFAVAYRRVGRWLKTMLKHWGDRDIRDIYRHCADHGYILDIEFREKHDIEKLVEGYQSGAS